MSTQVERWPYWLDWTLGDRLRKIRRGAAVDEGLAASAAALS